MRLTMVGAFYAELSAVMDGLGEPWGLVLVNDGSRDATLSMMEALRAVAGDDGIA
jgi:polyisoprenyl-phosphate glycosyltransferase